MQDCSGTGCSPDQCESCAGCGIKVEKIVLKVEWRHKGKTLEDEDTISKMMNELSKEMIVSGVELVYINNTFAKDIPDNSSEFFVNGRPLSSLVEDLHSPVSVEILRKGIFQALLRLML